MTVLKTTETVDWEEFYPRIGHLFYGVAAAGGAVNQEGLEALKKRVHRLWNRKGPELPGFGSYIPAKVDAVLDWLHLNETDWEYCLTGFGYLLNRFRDQIPSSMKDFIQSGAREIAAIAPEESNPALQRLEEMLD